jgi:hypothetical protein
MEKIRIRDPGLNIPESIVTSFGLKILKFLINSVLWIRIRDPVPFLTFGSETWDPGWKKFGSAIQSSVLKISKAFSSLGLN